MTAIFFILALAAAAVTWPAVAFNWRRIEMATKPGVILLLLAFVASNLRPTDWGDSLRSGMIWFVLGLICSLLGDVLLLPGVNRFKAGLGAFLPAQIFYTIGFNPIPPFSAGHLAAALPIVALATLPAVPFYRQVSAGLQAGKQASLRIPILLYTIAICMMLIAALFTNLRGGWAPQQALLVSLGAASFYLSDAILGWNRFVMPIQHGRLLNMVLYHTAQILITLGASIQYLS